MDKAHSIEQAKALINSIRGKKISVEERCEKAITLARLLLETAKSLQSYSEKKEERQLAKMMLDPLGKLFITAVTDQSFRSKSSKRSIDQMRYIIRTLGAPDFLSWEKRQALKLFYKTAALFPKLWEKAFKWVVRKATKKVIIPEKKLDEHIKKRRLEHIYLNINHLGEAVLGEQEALSRINTYLSDLQNPLINYISVKASTLFSQMNLLAWHSTIEILAERLRQLYRQAQKYPFIQTDGSLKPKFVNLDMEEYRDLHITIELFCKVLEEEEFYLYSAGIVLQAYLPDTFFLLETLTTWAKKRVEGGGAPIKIRLVKGANLAMEQLEARLKCWPLATYGNKADVDSNFIRLLDYSLQKKHATFVNIGVGSHNLFDVAYAMLLSAENEVEKCISFEMLEGMAEPIRRAVQKVVENILLYCPAANEDEFQYAIAYLVRRLDENSAEENFLRHLFDMQPGSKIWQRQANQFSLSCFRTKNIASQPKRIQNRKLSPCDLPASGPFCNEADTDFSIKENRLWMEQKKAEWKKEAIDIVPLVIDGREIITRELKESFDPNDLEKVLYTYSLASSSDINHALDCATKAQQLWKKKSAAERSSLLCEVAKRFREKRGALIVSMIADGAKNILEGDVEVSEAIDFIEYYRRQAENFCFYQELEFCPVGPILVASPWNFPCAIPTGCIAAALAAGNSVLFKPAPETVLTAWQLVQTFWEAGIDKKLLQFIPCHDEPAATELVKDARCAAIMLTGSTATAKYLQALRPGLHLLAETGGKNSVIVTSLADRDLAIKDVIHSAFSHSGQKCSACSLLILASELYDDSHFMQQLKDAASSLHVGISWDNSSKITPLIKKAEGALLQGLTTLEEGETWLLQPEASPSLPNLWSPGIKLGVTAKSFSYRNELFGPVLSVMRADNLNHAIELANGTQYGLTAGIHSLDEREQKLWLKKIVAGNCYINRTTTGAIVQRQPFGGCKQSSFGYNIKAGGPNYLLGLMQAKAKTLPKRQLETPYNISSLTALLCQTGLSSEEIELWQASMGSYAFFWKNYFSLEHDPSNILGQENILKYAAQSKIVLRVQEADSLLDIARCAAAATYCKTLLEISFNKEKALDLSLLERWASANDDTYAVLIPEDSETLSERLKVGDHVRFLSKPQETMLLQALATRPCNIVIEPVQAHGRVELLRYLREVSISYDYHRYGYLGMRAFWR